MEVKFSRPTAFPQEIVRAIEPVFTQLFQEGEDYRATGIVLTKLQEDVMVQLDLFGEVVRAEKFSKVYQAVDHMGSATVNTPCSWAAVCWRSNSPNI